MAPLEERSQHFLNSLDKLGFCVLPVFDQNEIGRLRQLYDQYFGQKRVEGMYATHNSNPIDNALKISRDIQNVVAEKLQRLFPEYEYFIGHFMVKGPNVDQEFSLHQDWNIVDETIYKSYQIWIPLQLTYPANGGMFVIPGSHKFFGNFRSGSYGIPVVPFDEIVEPLVADINMPAGDVLIYHNALFHASNSNTTDQLRIAVIVNFVEKKAPTAYFHKRTDLACTDLYPVTGNSLIAHLPQLEKGIIADDMPLGSTLPIQEIDNRAIGSEDLSKAFYQYFKTRYGTQIKQVHIAREQELEDELNEKGYKVINLLDPEQIMLFKRNYLSEYGDIERTPGRFTTLQYTDVKKKRATHDFLANHMKPILDRYFKDYQIPISLYYTKKAHTSGDIDLHADTTLILNHQLEPHYAIWIPLIDVDVSNGTLTVVPKSHLIKRTFFAASLGGYHNEHLSFLRQYELPFTLKAGQAVIFDNNLLHNSTANTTDQDRICFTLRLTHSASAFFSFRREKPEEDGFEVYIEKENYYMDEAWDGDNIVPTGKYLGHMRNSISKIDRKKLEQILEGS